jgi:hypothetical protein
MSMANRLPIDDLEEVTRDVSWVYVQAMYLVTAIVAERDARNREKTDAAPPVLPLEIAGPWTIEFMELLFEHKERLRHSFPGNCCRGSHQQRVWATCVINIPRLKPQGSHDERKRRL